MSRRISGYTRRRPPEIKVDVDLPGKMYGIWKGRKYGGWGSLLTPAVATTELIEAPQHIIDSIFQDELSVTAVNLADLIVLETDRPTASWKFARSLTKAESSLEYLRSICEEAVLISARRGNGQERMVALCNVAAPSITLTSSDVALDGVTPLCEKTETPLENIRNEFYLNYKYSYYKDAYDKQIYCTASADNLTDNTRDNTDGYGATYQALCSGSQTRYNQTIKWEFDADWIRTDAVANLFIKIMMNWLCYRKPIFKATLLYTANSLSLELGDRILINHSLLPTGISNTRQFIVTNLTDGGMTRIGQIDAEFTMIPETI